MVLENDSKGLEGKPEETMAFAVSSLVCPKSMSVHCLPSTRSGRFIVGSLTLLRRPLSFPVLLYPRGRDLSFTIVAASSRRKKKKQHSSQNHVKVEDEEEDAFELLFKQLEEDLKKDDMSFNDSDDEINDEDLVKLEQELADALGEDDEEMLNSASSDTEIAGDANEEEEGNDDADHEGDVRQVNLRRWQLRRLAKALKVGRRKTSIKSLAEEVCLDRALVLQLLREPPPDLLMMSLSLPDEPTAPVVESEARPSDTVVKEIHRDDKEPGSKSNVPVHDRQARWSAQKRLKRAQIDTLERIYRRTKRPTSTMISSIVHVTNIPRKKVIKWFEDKRAEDGVPEDRVPFRRAVA